MVDYRVFVLYISGARPNSSLPVVAVAKNDKAQPKLHTIHDLGPVGDSVLIGVVSSFV